MHESRRQLPGIDSDPDDTVAELPNRRFGRPEPLMRQHQGAFRAGVFGNRTAGGSHSILRGVHIVKHVPIKLNGY